MVFYFTGTGNSLYAAKALDEEPISIPRIMNRKSLRFTADKIGVVCPVHGDKLPAMVEAFMRKASFRTDYLYVVLTCGARCAEAVVLADRVLTAAGRTANYIAALRTVNNFPPAFNHREALRLEQSTEKQLARIKAIVQAKKSGRQPGLLRGEAESETACDPGKAALESAHPSFFITDACIGCGVCTKVCPAGRIALSRQRAVRGGQPCQHCYACIHACPKLAIRLEPYEKEPGARYRNEHISLSEIVRANNQTED